MLTRAMVVQKFLDVFEAPSYLEIGTRRGDTFHQVRATKKVAVDQQFDFPWEAYEPGPATEYHQLPSDEYFAYAGAEDLKFDVIYLDGPYAFSQTLRDLLNATSVLKEHGVIVVDDVIPNSYDASLPDLDQLFALRQQVKTVGVNWATDDSWMGDVYKIPFFVDGFMQQMSFATVAETHGQTVIWREARAAETLAPPSFTGVDRLDFRDTILRRSAFRLQPLNMIVARVRSAFALPEAGEDNLARGFPPDTLLRQIGAAAKQMPVPKVTSPELMPELIRLDAAKAWGKLRPRKTIRIHRIKNVYCNRDGLIFDQDLNVFTPTIAQYDPATVQLAREEVRAAILKDTVRRCGGASLLCGKIGMGNYGHWMVEMLPIAFLTRAEIVSQGWKVFVPAVHPHMQTVIRDSLSLIGIPAASLVEHDGQPAWLEELIVVSGLTDHGRYYLPATADCLQELATQANSDGSQKVWVSRVAEKRRLLHEEELQTALEAQGWRVIRPLEMTLREQIAACKGARHVAGVDGAGLTNLGFMSAGGQVTSFIPGVMPDLFFWALAANRGLHYHEVRCPLAAPSDDPIIPWNAPLQIGTEQALAALRS